MFLLDDGSLAQMLSDSFAWWCRVLLFLSIIVYLFCFLVFCGDVVVSAGPGCLIFVVWNSFFQGPVGFIYVFICAAVHWAIGWPGKCPANNYTAECIDETNRSLQERVSDHRNPTTSAIRNHNISTKHQKAELKDFTIIDRDINTPHHQTKEALHICIKDPSLNRNIGKVRIPSVFNKVLSPTQGRHLHLVFQRKRQLTLHTFLISIYNRSVIPMFTPFKLQDNWTCRSPPSGKHIGKQCLYITKGHLLQKYLGFTFSSLLISSTNKSEEGIIWFWKCFLETIFSQCYMNYL